MKQKKWLSVQLASAVATIAVGSGLLVAGFTLSPTGEIHNSVLIAFGETLTFAGSLMGVDYKYRRTAE